MARAHCHSEAAPVTPRSTTQAVNIDAVTTNSTAFREREPILDFEHLRQWSLAVTNPEPSVGRQRRIAEGIRQTAALAPTRGSLRSNNGEGQEGQARCPATGGYCGERGYGPCGIHSACAPLEISAYCE